MVSTSTPLALVSVYKVTGLPSCVPKGFCCTACSCRLLACAKARLPIVRLRKTVTHTVVRCFGIMRESVLRGPGSCRDGSRSPVELRSSDRRGAVPTQNLIAHCSSLIAHRSLLTAHCSLRIRPLRLGE